ncbi:VOC family protein [Cochleicola gelatinilyticus]|uniref:Bleomycin resistance protein n=1 Tax=Cochleicola gelatinilyticus TaxID=1763537 RepID=A0A167J4F0_9FLAO|nr:glyoxalase/bleomycin resistance/extradiol dioxygenase family protein [Cochleicola gelatinilyticus]OAB80327.1 bleomycin resistance protein [Cochleicola gelatinilyticus]
MNLNQVTVPSIDVEKSILFYKKLGLQLIVKSLPKYARFECPNGNTTFSIHQVVSVTESQSVWVYFEVENVSEKVSELQSKGITFETTPVEQSWLWIEAKLKDHDGNQIMIYHAGKNRKNPPWRI